MTANAGFREDHRDFIEGLKITHATAYAASLVPGTGFAGIAAGSLEFSTNVSLKRVPGYLTAPADIVRRPNRACHFSFYHPRRLNEDRNNMLDIGALQSWSSPYDESDVDPNTEAWGLLGEPTIDHYNTDVRVSVFFEGKKIGRNPGNPLLDNQSVIVPIGNSNFIWQGDNLAHPALDYFPWHLVFAQWTKNAGNKTKATAKTLGQKIRGLTKMGLRSVMRAARNAGIKAAADYPIGAVVQAGVFTQDAQRFTVVDMTDPVISHTFPSGLSPSNPYPVRAVDPGGSFFNSFVDDFRSRFTVSDDCGRSELVTVSMSPEAHPANGPQPPLSFFPTDSVRKITITAEDGGPSDSCPNNGTPCVSLSGNKTTLDIWVEVIDEEPPLLIAPNNRVIEANAAMEAQGFAIRADENNPEGDSAGIELGNPSVFDLGDRYPTVEDDGTQQFLVNRRTTVVWTAEDIAANTTTASQVITIKAPGTNTAPTAASKTATTRTSEIVEITLTGSDPDDVGGVFDPLNFEIEENPQNGFLVAPPTPYFIEDYRRTWQEVQEQNDICNDPNQTLPESTITFPRLVNVLDDGTHYVLGNFASCNEGGRQITVFDRDGDYLGRSRVFGNVESFEVLDGVEGGFPSAREPGIYALINNSGNQEDGVLVRYDILPEGTQAVPLNSWDFKGSGFPLLNVRAATMDSRGLVWVVASNQLGLFRFEDKATFQAADLELVDNVRVGSWTAMDGRPSTNVVVDKEDYVYVAQAGAHRVYKFEPADPDSPEPVKLIGWMGRCTSGENCDIENQRSYGFSCTDTTCETAAADNRDRDWASEYAACGLPEVQFPPWEAGCAPGQFYHPRKVSVDPNGTVYVADFTNQRVQRFTNTGEFAGEARSKCDGSCFVLGDFGRPANMSVNSFGFYVLDDAKKLLHVFEASPFSDVTTNSAVVKYQSNFDIMAANENTQVDTFSYSVNDGLAKSAPVDVNVTVNRNHRAPIAFSDVEVTETDPGTGQPVTVVVPVLPVIEDTPQIFAFTATDPDVQDRGSLTYRVVDQPENGQVVMQGADFVFQPGTNFFGDDSFTFVASDTQSSVPALESEKQTVQVTVAPVEDPPVLVMPEASDAPLGFPINITADLMDVDSDARDMLAYIDWGDGCIDRIEDTNDDGKLDVQLGCDIALPDGDGDMSGLVDLSLDNDSTGRLTAEHVYRTTGAKQARFCVADGRPPFVPGGPLPPQFDDCRDDYVDFRGVVDLNVVPMVDQHAIIEDSLERTEDEDGVSVVEPGEASTPVDVTIRLRNRVPSSSAVANGVDLGSQVISVTLGDRMELWSIAPGCSFSVPVMTCNVGPISVGNETAISFRVSGEPSILEDFNSTLTVESDSAASDADGGHFWATTIPFKMNPALDADNDGVVNGEDAFPADPNEQFDTDADGIGNNADLDDDGDAMPDTWENQYGLDRLNASDAQEDSDNDGLMNADEYTAHVNPNDPDSDKDSLIDGSDNCPADRNLEQLDEDVDGLGNACDPNYLKALAVLPDFNNNQSPTMAGLAISENGEIAVQVSDAATGQLVRHVGFLSSDWNAKQVLSIADGMLSGTIALRAQRLSDGLPIIQLRNAATGAQQANLYPWNANWKTIDMVLVPGEASFGDPAVATLARRISDGVMGVELRDPNDNSRIRIIYPLGPTWSGHGIEVVPNVNGAPAIAVLATRNSDGLTVVQVRSAVTGELIKNVYPLGLNFTPQEFQIIPDVDGDGVWDTAVRMTRDSDGLELIQIRNTLTQALIRNVYPIGAGGGGWSTQGFRSLGAGPLNQLAILSTRDSDGAMLVQIKEPLSGLQIRNTWFIGTPWEHQQGYAVIKSFSGTGVDELAVLTKNDDANTRLIQIRDGGTTDVIRNIYQVGSE